MSRLEKNIRDWLWDERHRPRHAERRLGRLLRELPDLGPATGFTVRVLTACGVTAPLKTPGLGWLLRAGWILEGAALAAAGLGVLALPGLGQAVPAGLVTALAGAAGERALLGIGDLLTLTTHLWAGCVRLGHLADALLRTPMGAALATASLATAYTLMWSLKHLLAGSGRTAR
jgi:hypothetical protein